MNCTQADEQLEGFWEGTLDPAAEEAFREHLGVCRSCRQRLSGLNVVDRGLRTAVRGWGAPSSRLGDRVMEAVMGAEAPRPARGPVWGSLSVRVVAAAAAVLLVVFSGRVWLNTRGGSALAEAVSAPAEPSPAPFFEPAPAAPLAMGKPFVIGEAGQTEPAPRAGTMKVTAVVRGVPVLLVEAFP